VRRAVVGGFRGVLLVGLLLLVLLLVGSAALVEGALVVARVAFVAVGAAETVGKLANVAAPGGSIIVMAVMVIMRICR
jgi:hypothetical protein